VVEVSCYFLYVTLGVAQALLALLDVARGDHKCARGRSWWRALLKIQRGRPVALAYFAIGRLAKVKFGVVNELKKTHSLCKNLIVDVKKHVIVEVIVDGNLW